MTLTSDEIALLRQMDATLSKVVGPNSRVEAYYEGSHRARMLGISIPPSFGSLRTAIGWPGIAVDSIEERLDFLGWSAGDELARVYAENDLAMESGMAHLDALIFGTSFVTVSAGESGEPGVLVHAHSPKRATGVFDPRTRRLSAGLTLAPQDDPDVQRAELLTPTEIITVERDGALRGAESKWIELDRFGHKLGRVPMVQLVNRRRTSRYSGRSEITRAIRSLTDQAVRTLLGMEVNREFYSFPQRWAMGADASAFQNDDGTWRTGWELLMSGVWAMEKDEDGDKPEVGQFNPASPAPYVDQIRALSRLMAAESACPEHYFGFVTDNPSSADALRAGEARLVKHAERRQTQFGQAWMQVGKMAAQLSGADVDTFDRDVSVRWRDAATPTRAAAADAAVKLVGSGILPASSSVALDMTGFTPDQQKQIQQDRLVNPTGAQRLAAAVNGALGTE